MTAGEVSSIAKRIRIASALVAIGLIVEWVTLSWSHPTAFLAFAFFGVSLVGLGVLFYLWSLLTLHPVEPSALDDD